MTPEMDNGQELSKEDLAAMQAMEREIEPDAPPLNEPIIETGPFPPASRETQQGVVVQPIIPASDAQPRTDDGKFAGKSGPKESQRVPVAELIEERKARQALEKELGEYKTRLESRLEEMQRRLAMPPVPEAPKPTLEADPLAALREITQRTTAIEEHQRVQQVTQQFAGTVEAQIAEYERANPDYRERYAFVRENRIAELRALGMADSQIPTQLANDEFQVAAGALQNKQNPAAIIARLAEHRGYKPKQAPLPAAQQRQGPGPIEQLATIDRGQQASKSLGNAGGVANEVMTLESLATMSDADFSKLDDAAFRRLMGG